MEIKATIIILLAIVISTKAYIFLDVSLEELSGEWHHEFQPSRVTIEPRNGYPVESICRDELSKKCRKSLLPTKYVYTVYGDSKVLIRDIDAFSEIDTIAKSEATFPDCVAIDGVYPLGIGGEFEYDIVQYEDGKIFYESSFYSDYCFSWNVFVTSKGEVKAFIYRKVDDTFEPSIFESNIPYTCDDNTDQEAQFSYFFSQLDGIKPKGNGIDGFPGFGPFSQPKCTVEFSTDTQLVTLKGTEAFITTCVDGPCLELTKKIFDTSDFKKDFGL